MEMADSVDVVDEVATETEQLEQVEQAQAAPADQATEAVGDEVIVTIGEEAPPSEDEIAGKPAPEWVKELRKEAKEKSRRIRELESQLKQQLPETTVTLGQKPSLESCDYDAEKFEQELGSYYERKRKADEANAKAEQEQENQRKQWQSRLESYAEKKSALKVKDFDDAESTVKDHLSPIQQSVVVNGADNPALVVYAIGKNPSKAKELAAITDPVKFAFAVAKLETQLKVTNRAQVPPPEKVVRGNVAGAAAVDSQLNKLIEEAQRTGDSSKVRAYRQSQRAAK